MSTGFWVLGGGVGEGWESWESEKLVGECTEHTATLGEVTGRSHWEKYCNSGWGGMNWGLGDWRLETGDWELQG